LAACLRNYTVRLLNNVRGRDELDIVLNKTGKIDEEKYERLARLDLALKYNQKEFVAHSNCQQKLVETWHMGLRHILKMNGALVTLLFVLFIGLLPFLIIIYILAPRSKMGKFLSQPLVKFTSHTVTYFVFLALLIISGLQVAHNDKMAFSKMFPGYVDNFTAYVNSNLTYTFPQTDFYIRSSFPSKVDLAITIWLIGLTWHELKQIWHYSAREYLRSASNILDSCMITLYAGSFALKYYTFFMVSRQLKRLDTDEFWSRIASLNGTDLAAEKDIFGTFYWLNVDRWYIISNYNFRLRIRL
jgi:hypothetical protein